jgi:hypothetical protein
MKNNAHSNEEALIAYREGERKSRDQIAAHLRECAACRESLARIESVFSALSAMPTPDPGEDFEHRVWRQIAPRLAEKPATIGWWQAWLAPGRLAAVGALAGVIALAFLAGRITKRIEQPNITTTADASKVRERVLVIAVGEHLGKSEMVLMELENAQPAERGQTAVDISATQRRAENLLEDNRLYRQTALREGDRGMASTLDELERVLLDIANSPDTVTPAQFESLRKRIADRGILFKVRVVNQDLQERDKPANGRAINTVPHKATPQKNESGIQDRSKI